MNKNIFQFDEDDFGFEFTEDPSDRVEHLTKEINSAQGKAQMMYDAIMPLLSNLKKDPLKPNIYWPDREKKIDNFIKKLDSILNS